MVCVICAEGQRFTAPLVKDLPGGSEGPQSYAGSEVPVLDAWRTGFPLPQVRLRV